MRVLMVVRPAAGGMKEHVLALCRGLAERGHEAEIAAPSGSDIAVAAGEDGIAVHPVPIAGPLDPVRDPAAVLAIWRVIAHGHYDLVHCLGFKAGFVGRLGARLAGARAVVVTAHNHVLSRDDTAASTKARYRTRAGREAKHHSFERAHARRNEVDVRVAATPAAPGAEVLAIGLDAPCVEGIHGGRIGWIVS